MQLLIKKLIEGASKYSQRHYSTRKPDYRIKHDVVYCAIEIYPVKREIRLYLRTETLNLMSTILDVKDAGAYYTGPAKWVSVTVDRPDQLDEALRLIEQCYRYRKDLYRAK